MTIFLVFLMPGDNCECVDEDTAKAFHSMEDAETYRAELNAADEVECIAFAKSVKAGDEGFLYATLYKNTPEKDIAKDRRSEWVIKEIPLK